MNLAEYLADLDHQALVDMLLERAAADGLFDARLRAAAASKSGGRPDLTSYRQAFAAAFETDGYVDYREAYDYTTGIRSVLDEPQQHDRALALLRKRTNSQRDRSLLVAVLLLDGEVDQAWAEATAGACRRDQWLELARRREDDHPDDAIPLWREEVTREIVAMSNATFANAVALIERIGRLTPIFARGC